LGRIKLPDQICESIWDSLPHNIVVHGAKLMADSGLNLGVEATLLAGRSNSRSQRLASGVYKHSPQFYFATACREDRASGALDRDLCPDSGGDRA
jgi:hypothetical protein